MTRAEKIELLKNAAAGKLTIEDFLNDGQIEIWMNTDGTGFRNGDKFVTVEQMEAMKAESPVKFYNITLEIK
jgi:hypothetical protein